MLTHTAIAAILHSLTAGSTYFPQNLPFLFEHFTFHPVEPGLALVQSEISPKAVPLAIHMIAVNREFSTDCCVQFNTR